MNFEVNPELNLVKSVLAWCAESVEYGFIECGFNFERKKCGRTEVNPRTKEGYTQKSRNYFPTSLLLNRCLLKPELIEFQLKEIQVPCAVIQLKKG